MVIKRVKTGSATKLADLGIWIVIVVFVVAQFVEVSLFSIGNIPITLQKALAAVLYPFSAILMGRIRVSRYMVLFALALLVSYTIAFLANAYLPPEAGSAFIVILVGFAGATVLYTALTLNGEKGFRRLAYTWLTFSVITALITVLQAVGVFPFLTVPEEHLQFRETGVGLYRGVGLKFDPNFQALMLVIGLAFALSYVSTAWRRFVVVSVILLGIIGTFSRMGLILAVLLIIANPVVRALNGRRGFARALVNVAVLILVVSVMGFALHVWAPPSVSEYLGRRFAEVWDGLIILVSGNSASSAEHLSSAETRALLAKAALTLALQNWTVGVGAYQTDRVIFEYVGIDNVAHNTYLELFLIGGIWGILSVLCYVVIVLRGLWGGGNCQFVAVQRNTLLTLTLAFAFAGMFLSLTYNSIIWLPIAIALATREWVRGRR